MVVAHRMNAAEFQLARDSDAPLIAEMSGRLVESGLVPSWPAERVLRHVRHADSVVLTAKHDRALQGFAIMQFGDATAHLNLLAVEAGRQRRGIGRGLVTWLEESARVAGTFLVQLELRATNAGARAFYESLGYRETGRVPGYYQRLEDAVRMARDLRVGRDATA
jgi:ribosomal-protein-alanine N-acetyltransferase